MIITIMSIGHIGDSFRIDSLSINGINFDYQIPIIVMDNQQVIIKKENNQIIFYIKDNEIKER